MTADPRIISNAKVIEALIMRIFQMADRCKVIHPRAVEIAMKSDLPIVSKNTFSIARNHNNKV